MNSQIPSMWVEIKWEMEIFFLITHTVPTNRLKISFSLISYVLVIHPHPPTSNSICANLLIPKYPLSQPYPLDLSHGKRKNHEEQNQNHEAQTLAIDAPHACEALERPTESAILPMYKAPPLHHHTLLYALHFNSLVRGQTA